MRLQTGGSRIQELLRPSHNEDSHPVQWPANGLDLPESGRSSVPALKTECFQRKSRLECRFLQLQNRRDPRSECFCLQSAWIVSGFAPERVNENSLAAISASLQRFLTLDRCDGWGILVMVGQHGLLWSERLMILRKILWRADYGFRAVHQCSGNHHVQKNLLIACRQCQEQPG